LLEYLKGEKVRGRMNSNASVETTKNFLHTPKLQKIKKSYCSYLTIFGVLKFYTENRVLLK